MSTRVVRLRSQPPRAGARNEQTQFVNLADRHIEAASFQDLFMAHYAVIRRTCESFRHNGIAVIAIDRRGVAGTLCIRARSERPSVAIVGRHSLADLHLADDPGLSLRHLLLVVEELDTREASLRVLDLRTARAFEDEHGRPVEALMAEGPVFLRLGRYALFCIETGDGIEWPDDALDGWQCIPPRTYIQESEAQPGRWGRRAARRRRHRTDRGWRKDTLVQTMSGPRRAKRRLRARDEACIGQLSIETLDGTHDLEVGVEAARQGILIGRYERCDSEGLAGLDAAGLSRVHLLLLGLAGKLYAIDTASTNGSWLDDEEEIRCLALDGSGFLVLGERLATLRFRPAPDNP